MSTIAFTMTDIGVAAAVAVIIFGFAIIGFARGVVRMAFGLLALAAGSIAALWGFQKGGAVAGTVVSNPEPWMSAVVGVVLGLAVFFVARALFGVLLSPIRVADGTKQNFGFLGGVLGLAMGVGFAWFLLSGVRYVGTLAEMDWLKAATADGKINKDVAKPALARLKRMVDGSVLGELHEEFDLLNDKAKANLAKLIILDDNGVARPEAAKDRPLYDAVYQEDIRKMLDQQHGDLTTFIEDRQYAHVLRAVPIKEVSGRENAQVALKAVDIEKSIGLVEDPPPQEGGKSGDPDKKEARN